MAGNTGEVQKRQTQAPASDRNRKLPAHHWLAFLGSGCIAFSVDALVLETGVRLAGLDPLVARICAIITALVVSWMLQRTLTFAIAAAPTFGEFVRFAASASSSALLNYAVFAILLIVMPSVPRLAALAASSAFAMFYTYLSLRYVVFQVDRSSRNRPSHEEADGT